MTESQLSKNADDSYWLLNLIWMMVLMIKRYQMTPMANDTHFSNHLRPPETKTKNIFSVKHPEFIEFITIYYILTKNQNKIRNPKIFRSAFVESAAAEREREREIKRNYATPSVAP